MQTPSGLFPRRKNGRKEGVALVIVLAFVVILTGVIVAYFTRALANRQISNSSASQTKVALFAQGASDTIIANLQEEIILSSGTAATVVGSGTATSTIYYPANPAAAVPQTSGTGAPNFVIGSAYNQNFYSGTPNIPSNASPVSSTVTSLNGRSVSLARWNSHYLLPLPTTGTDSTPVTTGSYAFAAPYWVLVARNGSNPVVTSPSVAAPGATAPAAWSGTNGATVIGRYAYAIYNEGGLLDANVAGYPSTSSTTNKSTPYLSTYKPNLAFADLTQLPGGLTQTQVDKLVAWRNYASAQAPETYDNPTPFSSLSGNAAAASGTNYYNYTTSNPSGFLAVSSTAVNNNGVMQSGTSGPGETDRQFGSRQELIAFIKNGLGLSGTALNVLNYLGTFSRGLDQPSYAPDPNRPTIAKSFPQGATNGGNNAVNLDAQINPGFLSVRVSGTFARNDGTIAVPGEPLVKTRFPLSKLAWLTYLGPSAVRAGNADVASNNNPGATSQDYDLWQLVHLYGIPVSYLLQGTPANIQMYFGLNWQPDTYSVPSARSGGLNTPGFHDGEYKWFYNIDCETGGNANGASSPGVVVSATAGSIARLMDLPIAKTPREPNFFELLKAAVIAGSKAKGCMNLTTLNNLYGTTHPYYYQTKLDTSLDYAIMQLGVNIIDQSKVDGYSTRIVFNDNSGNPAHEFRGVQNLPYFYRVQSGVLKVRMENVPSLSNTGHEIDAPPGTLKDTGVAVLMHIPTIWNPYDANSPLGAPGPTGSKLPNTIASPNFRLVADSVQPDFIGPGASLSGYNTWCAAGWCAQPTVAGTTTSTAQANGTMPLYTTGALGSGTRIPGSIGNPTAWPTNAFVGLSPSNSVLTFVVPNNTLFREPTILARPNIPNGSNLHMQAPLAIFGYNSMQNSAGSVAYTGTAGGFLSDVANPLDLPTDPGSQQAYIGICAGTYPVAWYGSAQTTGTAGIYRSVTTGFYIHTGAEADVTYRLQYRDPNTQDTAGTGWVTYDEKFNYLDCTFLASPLGTKSGNLSDQADGAQGGDWESYADPRTSRFAAVTGRDLEDPTQTPGGVGNAAEWADPNNDEGVTDRPDYNSGYAISTNRPPNNPPGNYELDAFVASGWKVSTISNAHFRIGLLSQNSPSVQDNGIRFAADSGQNATSPEGQTYYQDPDGVVRGAMGSYNTASGAPATGVVGLPLATAYPAQNGTPYNFASTTGTYQGESRPYFLHRPFRSVAELGYVFSGMPWKNIDFFTPQSGDSGLLDVFSAYESPTQTINGNALVAGVVSLNTRQEPVLQAILAGAYPDEAFASGTANTPFSPLSGQQAYTILTTTSGTNLLTRTANTTTTGAGPLQNLSDLVGRYNSTLLSGSNYAAAYTGPSGDLSSLYTAAFSSYTAAMQQTMLNVQRFRQAFVRPLAAVGNTRVWNLMIDLIAQTGRYPQGASNPANFIVEGEQRYWVHIAIDRLTGQVLDKQIEIVKE